MGMAAGGMDRRIRIEGPVEVDDGYNVVERFEVISTVWASYRPSQGREAREALGQEATLPATFRLRWSRTMAVLLGPDGTRYRVRFPAGDDGRVFDIKSAVEVGRREGIEIQAVAGDDSPMVAAADGGDGV